MILGLLPVWWDPKVVSYLSRGKTDTAKLQIEQLAAAMDLYLLDVGRYRQRDEGISALLQKLRAPKTGVGPYLRKDELPFGPWGNEFHYEPPGQNGNIELYSWEPTMRKAVKGTTRILPVIPRRQHFRWISR